MKNLLLTLVALLCLGSSKSFAQGSILNQIDTNLLGKYIQAAKANPRREIMGLQIVKAKADVPITTLGYLDIFNASYYYRPNNQAAIDINNPYTVNGFQFGVSVNLGTLLQKPYLIKKAKIDYKIAQLEAKEYDEALVNEVKSKYYDYVRALSELKLNSQVVLDNKSMGESLRNKFEKGEITLDVYNQSRVAQSAVSAGQIQSEVNFLKAKDALEQIIGKKLEEIK
ncbi:MAG: TolC family protein [Candidatus Pedobacter colombiensis]|uniref:TolC family protein n=1 Tax=Candidatus Pedobacter colombiensis TaxID=3121371 RepID=A0AAJ6B7K3_9SPHI|nr:TolC family protein [Pedobacter sp.]WEK21197.1 MAG: TolC family protein [Pedobacter sp.]